MRRLFLEINQVLLFYLEVCPDTFGICWNQAYAKGKRIASRWKSEFGDSYFIEITRTGRPNEETFSEKVLKLLLN